MSLKEILFIVGPTGMGKSAVGIELAKKLDGEIVSADSMQLYRGMNIGTAKVSLGERYEVPHHLIDIVDLSTQMDVSIYREKAMATIEDILSRGKCPIVVGGSGMYVRSLTDGLFEGPASNPELRQKLEKLADEKGNEALFEKLKKVDPKASQKIGLNNRRRLIRALEVYEAEKKPISELQTQWKNKDIESHSFRIFGLTMERAALYKRLNQRVDQMFEEGLVEETKSLIEKGLKSNPVALQAIGYKEVVRHLEEKAPLEETKEAVKQATRQFAKRQLTWFRRDPRVEWIEVTPQESIDQMAQILYNKVRR